MSCMLIVVLPSELLTVGPAPDKRLSLSTGQLSPAKGKRLGRHSMGPAGSVSNLSFDLSAPPERRLE